MLPNCIVNGVAKSGTTSIYHYLKAHHQVFMSERKELNYFSYGKSDDSGKFDIAVKPVKTPEEYASYFNGSEKFKIRGEASPTYFSSAGCARNIKNEVPDVKLITTLRNPADRAYSGYLMHLRKKRIDKNVDDPFSIDQHWVQLGFYYERLKEYYDSFDSSQIKIVLLEDLKSDKKKELVGIFEFLEIDNNYEFESAAVYNSGHVPKNVLINNLLRNNQFVNKSVKPMLPKKLKQYARKFEYLNQSLPEPMSEEVRARLNSYYKEEIDKVQMLTGKDLTSWS